MAMLRLLSLAGLVLALALTSVVSASARHMPRAAGMVELCTLQGVALVAVDAEGNPVGPAVPCPDCTPALLALAEPARLAERSARVSALFVAPMGTGLAPARHPPAFHARAPPALV